MRELLLAGLAVGMLATAAPAQAGHGVAGFRGGCSFGIVNEEPVTGQSLLGDASIVVVATDSAGDPDLTASITNAYCEVIVNNVSHYVVCRAPDGTGVTANVCRADLAASDTDTTRVLTHATINGVEYTHEGNGDVAGNALSAVVDAIEVVLQVIADNGPNFDAVVCSFLWLVAPTVNVPHRATGLYVDTVTDCDVYLGDTPDEDRLVDFWPYNDPETVRP